MVRFVSTLYLLLTIQAAVLPAEETWQVVVRETAGIARFKYPLSGEFRAKETDATFELRDGGQRIPAQFTRLDESRDGKNARWSVNFAIDLAPREARKLTLVRRAMPVEVSRSRRGLSVQRGKGKIRVLHPSLQFVVPDDLDGLLGRIVVRDDDWLVAGSPGLVVQLRDGGEVPLWNPGDDAAKPTVKLIKSGPLAVRLEFSGRQITSGSETESVVVLDFPLGKSWVRVDWTLHDPADAIAVMSAGVRLRLESKSGQPVLADVGADGWTYAALRNGETLMYQAARRSPDQHVDWQVERAVNGVTTPYVLPGAGVKAQAPRGWGHLMDRTRATAIAVDRFAETTRDRIDLSANGLVQLRREFAPRAVGASDTRPKRFTFWLHVVDFPPQVGAATSPQSMLSAPQVQISAVTDAASSGN